MPTLFWSAPEGAENQQIQAFNSGQGGMRMVAVPVAQSDVLPAGDFVGQMLYWSGASWVAVPVGVPVARIDGLLSVDPSSTALNLSVAAGELVGEQAILRSASALATIAANPSEWLALYADGTVVNQISGTSTAVAITASTEFEAATYTLQSSSHVFRVPNAAGTPTTNLTLAHDGDDMEVGFLGHAPVPRQSLVGQTTQEQSDSLVAALVACGLSSDARTPNNAQGVIGWTLAGPQVLTLVPAGHAPGLYEVTANLYMKTAAVTGNCSGSFFSWSEPTVGAATLVFGALAVTTTGLLFTVLRSILSDGVDAITYTITPALITGAPVANLSASFLMIAGPVL